MNQRIISLIISGVFLVGAIAFFTYAGTQRDMEVVGTIVDKDTGLSSAGGLLFNGPVRTFYTLSVRYPAGARHPVIDVNVSADTYASIQVGDSYDMTVHTAGGLTQIVTKGRGVSTSSGVLATADLFPIVLLLITVGLFIWHLIHLGGNNDGIPSHGNPNSTGVAASRH